MSWELKEEQELTGVKRDGNTEERVLLAGREVNVSCFVQTSLVLALEIPQHGKPFSPGKLRQLVTLSEGNCMCKGPEADGSMSHFRTKKRASVARTQRLV